MKAKTILSVLWAMVPLLCGAQDDDMYFVPKKKTEPRKKVETPVRVPVMPVARDEGDKPVVRDVDEYNRRYNRNVYGAVENDTLYLDEAYAEASDEAAAYDDDGNWVNGFTGTDDDYAYARRLLRFRSPSLGIPVSSPLYWDLCYGPGSMYWNVYDDGLYAYAFPTYWNYAYYHGTPYYSWSFGWGGGYWWPHYNSWYGWHSPFYDPWYAGWHPHRPHWGGHPGWFGTTRTHSSRREGVWFSPRGGRPTMQSGRTVATRPSGTRPSVGRNGGRSGSVRSTGTVARPGTVTRRRGTTSSEGRVTMPSTRTTRSSATQRSTTTRSTQPAPTQPSRSSGGSLGGSSRSGGFSSPGGGFGGGSRSGGGGTRSGGGGGRR